MNVQHCFILCRFIQGSLLIYLSVVGATAAMPRPTSLVIFQELWAVLMWEGALQFLSVLFTHFLLSQAESYLWQQMGRGKERVPLFPFVGKTRQPDLCFVCKWGNHMSKFSCCCPKCFVTQSLVYGETVGFVFFALTMVALHVQCKTHAYFQGWFSICSGSMVCMESPI